MATRPLNEKIHQALISKGYSYKQRIYVDVYSKDETHIFVYMNDHIFMVINGRSATQKEFEDATQLSS
jgi:hypothetical protein